MITPAYITQHYLTQIGDEHDATLQAMIDNASRIVTDLLAPVVFADDWASASALLVRHSGAERLYLPAHKTGTVATVTRLDDSLVQSDYTAETGDLYGTVEVNRALYRRQGWARGRYSITAQWGYGAAPASVKEVLAEMVVNIWRAKDSGNFSDVVGIEGANAVGYSKALTALQKQTLGTLRTRMLGGVRL